MNYSELMATMVEKFAGHTEEMCKLALVDIHKTIAAQGPGISDSYRRKMDAELDACRARQQYLHKRRKAADKLGEMDLDAAAKKLAEVMDYPWTEMPSLGRNNMRKNAAAIIAAALGIDDKVSP